MSTRKQEFKGYSIQVAFVEPGTKRKDVPESEWFPAYDNIGGQLPFYFLRSQAVERLKNKKKDSGLLWRIVKVKATIEHP